ncbi:hypothetical protein L6452_43850 [Arctium lappa]|uniref:Uncharacterized protein n=1 Tax=Arctium lappa TaxID=4217 RepID=A0ACB8XDI9_ARCLA|nr:hypothetical protein L6452_43850 [Arctium lappa]
MVEGIGSTEEGERSWTTVEDDVESAVGALCATTFCDQVAICDWVIRREGLGTTVSCLEQTIGDEGFLRLSCFKLGKGKEGLEVGE